MSSYNFPDDLLPDLLSRLPIKSILKFQCVSKLWQSIIRTRKLSLMHAKHSSDSMTQISLCKQNVGDDGEQVYKLCEIKVDGVVDEFRPLPDGISRKSTPRLVGSSNGVLCLQCRGETTNTTTIILWNPLSNEFQCLPPLPNLPSLHVCTYGFGYDEVNDDYKVLCFGIYWLRLYCKNCQAPDDEKDYAIVYSLKSKTWRSIDKFPIPSNVLQAGALFDGALHWLSKDPHHPLISFDLSKEEFKCCLVSSSQPLSQFSYPYLNVLQDGNLCLSLLTGKVFSIQLMGKGCNSRRQFEIRPDKGCMRVTPIAYVESPKPLLMMYQEGIRVNNLCFYDLQDEQEIKCKALNIKFFEEVFPYIKTLEFN